MADSGFMKSAHVQNYSLNFLDCDVYRHKFERGCAGCMSVFLI